MAYRQIIGDAALLGTIALMAAIIAGALRSASKDSRRQARREGECR
jgi:hypothetical protein